MESSPQDEPVAAMQVRALDHMPAVTLEPPASPAVSTALYGRLHRKLRAACRRFGMNAADADEAAHDGVADEWLRQDALHSAAELDEAGEWISKEAGSAASKNRRYARKHTDLPADTDPQARDASVPDADATLNAADMRRQYAAEMATWSERRKEVMALRQAGLEYAAIASALGISVDAVKWHVKRALSRLRIVFADHNPPKAQAGSNRTTSKE